MAQNGQEPVDVIQDMLRDALRFLGPILADFRFVPAHAMTTMAFLYRGASVTPEKAQRQKIFDHEKKGENQAAVDVFLDWLLNVPSDHALPAFFQALQKDTDEHKRVYCLLAMWGIYQTSDSHRRLLSLLTDKLNTNFRIMAPLLACLTHHGLLTDEHKEMIMKVFRRRWGQRSSCSPPSSSSSSTSVCTEVGSEQAGVSETERGEGENSQRRGESDPEPKTDDMMPEMENSNEVVDDAELSEEAPQQGPAETSEDQTSTEFRPLDEAVKYLLACLYYRQVEILISPADTGTSNTDNNPCDRCRVQDGREILGRPGCVWTDRLVHVLKKHPALSSVLSGLPDRRTYIQLWTKTLGALRMFGREDSEDTGSTASGETAVPSYSAQLAEYLYSDKLERTRQYVDKCREMQHLADDSSSITSQITLSSDNNPPPGPPLIPRSGGVLRQEEEEELRKGVISLRPYQEELLDPARKGHNVLIWLPTGTGKTYLVLQYAKEHLETGIGKRVVFVVPRVRLAQQQHARFEAFLPQYKPHLRTGETTGRIPWQQLLQTSRIFVLTAECLVRAVEQKRVQLSEFSLLVLDECHHARGGHPLRNLMNLYMDQKFSRPAQSVPLPQIMGLTASPGVGKARSDDIGKALEYLRQLFARLDIQDICSVREHKQDLEQYVHEPKHEMLQSEKRKQDPFKEHIEAFMEKVEKLMYSHGDVEMYMHVESAGRDHLQRVLGPPVNHRGGSEYTEWAHGLEKKLMEVENKKAFYVLMACADLLKLLQRALILNEDCRAIDALNFLKKEVRKRRAKIPDTAKIDHQLCEMFDEEVPTLEADCRRKGIQNPKLKLLRKIILKSTCVKDVDGDILSSADDLNISTMPSADSSEGPRVDSAALPETEPVADDEGDLYPGSGAPLEMSGDTGASDPNTGSQTLREMPGNVDTPDPDSLAHLGTMDDTSTAFRGLGDYPGSGALLEAPVNVDTSAPYPGSRPHSDTSENNSNSEAATGRMPENNTGSEALFPTSQNGTGSLTRSCAEGGVSVRGLNPDARCLPNINAPAPENCPDESRLLNDGTQEADVDSASAFWEDESDLDFGEDLLLDDNVRGMVFVRTLDLSKALVEFMRDDPVLKRLNPARITGVNASVEDGGMTKSEVTEVMGNFNAGRHKMVVCTSAAEEGLDFQACNLVIRYDYVTSMVSMIQTRGRARQEDSRYCVMGDLTSESMAKERANLASELLMRNALVTLQTEMDNNPGAYLDSMARRQRQAYDRRWKKDLAEAKRERDKLPNGYYTLRCRMCRQFACRSSQIRMVKLTNRVVIGDGFRKRYQRLDTKYKKTYDQDLPHTGEAVHCKRCGLRWGIFVRSQADGAEFPVITIKSFLIQDAKDQKDRFTSVEKWSKAFDVQPLSEEDLEWHKEVSGAPDEEGGAEEDAAESSSEEGEVEETDEPPTAPLSSVQEGVPAEDATEEEGEEEAGGGEAEADEEKGEVERAGR